MKKTVISLIVGASLAIAPAAFALTSMSADNMKSATGQAGVSIAVDGVEIETFTGSTAYIDTDGAAGGLPGAIIIGNRHTMKNYDALANGAAYLAQFSRKVNTLTGAATLDTTDVKGRVAQASGLLIDVGACALLSAADFINVAGNEATDAFLLADGTLDHGSAAVQTAVGGGLAMGGKWGVVLGLPTLMISTSADSYTVSSAGVAADGSYYSQNDFIKISKGASVMAILGGTVEIAAH